jgi:DNA modification methylase
LVEGFQPKVELIVGDAETSLKKLKTQSANCCATSPPYFQLRDYGVENDLGLLATIDESISAMVNDASWSPDLKKIVVVSDLAP